MIFLKKGAMFGLDARISLAIFGALSVISGAALYSAIQSAKSEQWRQYFVEVVKATEAYYLDMGEQLSVQNATLYYMYASDLVSNRTSSSNWKGPYISPDQSSGYYMRDSMTRQLNATAYTSVWLRKGSTWTEMNDNTTDGYCVVGDSDCNEWIIVYPAHIDQKNAIVQIFNNLDKLVDSGDGELAGIVRLNSGVIPTLMYKGMPHKRTS